jgi:GMP reductase
MRIETEIKLDFKDVLIRPKRSTLSTRSNVDVSREFRFRHAQVDYHGVPIIASNMDTTGTFEMARALDPFLLSTALHKHYAVDELVAFFSGLERKSAAFYSMGIAPADEEKFGRVMEAAGMGADAAVRYVCIDVANGYTEGFVRLVAKIRERYPHLVIMAGNVVTGEMTEELILSGADIVKVGIGPGSSAPTAAVRRQAMSPRHSVAVPTSSCWEGCSPATTNAPATSSSATARSIGASTE